MTTPLKTKKKNRSTSGDSELNQTKKTLLEQEEEFLTILESSQDAIFAKDMQGRYTFINSAGMKFMNRKINEIIGKRDNELFDEESAKKIMSVDHKVLLNKCSMSLETCFGQGDDEHWYYATISPNFSSDGELKGTIGVSRDMTYHRRLENALRESQADLLTILESSQDAIFAKDMQGRYTFINSAGAALLDLSSPEIIDKCDDELFAKDTAKEIMAFDQKVMQTKQPQSGEKCFGEGDHERRFYATVSPAFSADGNLEGVIGISRDMTDYRRTQEELWESEACYHELYDNTPAMFLTLDAQGVILDVNAYGAKHLGYTVKELKNKSIFEFMPSEDRREVKQTLKRVLHAPGKLFTTERRYLKSNGSIIWVRDYIRVVLGKDGKPNIPMVTEDITEAREISHALSYKDTHDLLTGLTNRDEFERQIKHSLFTTRETHVEHAMCLLDLDQFKVINETCSHVAGDELLRQIGKLMKDFIRQRDLLARLGGDEFGILMENCSVEQAMPKITSLHNAVKDYVFRWEGKSFNITASIGLISVNEASENQTGVLSMADQAVYTAKELGRNRIHVYDASDTNLELRRKEMEGVSLINSAFEENRFLLYYQTIVPVRGGNSGEHYELLIRMKDVDGNIVPPIAFLPAAERYNLAGDIDRWVVQTAFSWLQSHPEALDKLSHCGINLSGQSMVDDEMLDFVITQLDKYEIPPEKICFEVTETAAIENLSRATVFIRALKELGCRFALDDFGSGMSSFAYLKNLPVDFLKIDGAFVKNMADNDIDFAMVKSIHDIGHVMGMQTIAEFVEDDAILSKLMDIGVDYAQGYGIAKPQSIESMM